MPETDVQTIDWDDVQGMVLRGYGTLGEGKAQAADLSDPLTHLTVGLLAIGALLNNRRDCYEKPEHPPAHS